MKRKILQLKSRSPRETRAFGQAIALNLKRGLVLALKGDLGSGKTEFVKGLARGLGVKQPITSPTFLILARYTMTKGRFRALYHLDLYRVKGLGELVELGFREIVKEGSGEIVAVEWPEKINSLLPHDTIFLHFRQGKQPNVRMIKLWKKS